MFFFQKSRLMKMNIILQHQGQGRVLYFRRGLQDAQVTGGTAEGALQTGEGFGEVLSEKQH